MDFTGKVSSRSSKQPGVGPPGERELLELNPQRIELLLRFTGWKRLEPGTLNLEVGEETLALLLDNREPRIFEPPETVHYPDQYRDIPMHRKGYRYFAAKVERGVKSVDVLLRRAVNPVRGRIELFADVHLRSTLGVSDGDDVKVVLP